VGRWPIVFAALCACALLAGCGSHQQRKTAPASQSACINAKQLATLQREIRNVTIPGDKDFAFRDVEVWGGCGSKHTVHASIAQRAPLRVTTSSSTATTTVGAAS
jgi:hypothetical protein